MNAGMNARMNTSINTMEMYYANLLTQATQYSIDCKMFGAVCTFSEIENAVALVHSPEGCAYFPRFLPTDALRMKLLGRMGVTVNVIFPGCSVSDIRRMSAAELNFMRRSEKSAQFMQTIQEYCRVDYDDRVNYGMKRYRGNLPLFYNVPVCVAGDLSRISGMCKFLERELGMNVELAYATSMCMEKFDVPCTTFVEESQNEFRDKVSEIDFKILFGTDSERWIRNDAIIFSFPSFTRMSFMPYLGNGTLNLISDIYEQLVMYGFGNNR